MINVDNQKITRPNWAIKIVYALGQFGWSLCAYAATNLITYFYLPPETGGVATFPSYIYQGALLGFVTVIGFLTLGGRVFDAITDPLIANWSDRWKKTPGRRKPFLWMGAIPFALFSVLVFFPITSHESILNSAWLAFCLLGFFFFMTVYVTPYTAWLSELGHNPNERLNISTIISVTWALGFAVGTTIPAVQQYFEQHYSSTASFQIAISIYALLAAVLMLLPALFINETKYSLKGTSDLTAFQSVKTIQLGMVYYVTVLIQQEKEQITFYSLVLFALSFLFYIPVNLLTKKTGKKPIISLSFIIYIFVFIGIFFIGKVNFPESTHLLILTVLAAFPVAVFGILPNAIIADHAEADARKGGENKAGMYFGVRMFMMKLGVSVTNFVFPALLIFGKSTENNLGVRLTAVFALFVCLLGWLVFRKYKEVRLDV